MKHLYTSESRPASATVLAFGWMREGFWFSLTTPRRFRQFSVACDMRRFWLWVLLSPFVAFAVLDIVGYLLKPFGYYALTDWLVANVPLPILILETILLCVALCLHWWDAWQKKNKSIRAADSGRMERKK